jgi:hypothetical protein
MPTLFEDEDVILYLLRRRRSTEDGLEHVIADTSFVRCRLLGPMHVRLDPDVLVENCTFVPSRSRAVEALDPRRPYVGAFRVTNCSFVDCEFDDVKVMVPAGHELLRPKRPRSHAAA